MFTAPKHKVRARSLSFWGTARPSWTVLLTLSPASEVVTYEPSHSIKGPRGGKEHRPQASHFLWKYLTGHSSCAGYIRFSYCKHWNGLLGCKVKASYVETSLRVPIRGYLDNCVDKVVWVTYYSRLICFLSQALFEQQLCWKQDKQHSLNTLQHKNKKENAKVPLFTSSSVNEILHLQVWQLLRRQGILCMSLTPWPWAAWLSSFGWHLALTWKPIMFKWGSTTTDLKAWLTQNGNMCRERGMQRQCNKNTQCEVDRWSKKKN